MATLTATLVPGFQNSLGRQCASRLPTQAQPPGWLGVDVTVILRSKAALSVTGLLNMTMTGMAMPTVLPFWMRVAEICCFAVSAVVENVVVADFSVPAALLPRMASV